MDVSGHVAAVLGLVGAGALLWFEPLGEDSLLFAGIFAFLVVGLVLFEGG